MRLARRLPGLSVCLLERIAGLILSRAGAGGPDLGAEFTGVAGQVGVMLSGRSGSLAGRLGFGRLPARRSDLGDCHQSGRRLAALLRGGFFMVKEYTT